MNKQIGILTKKVINLLDLNLKKELPIYIGDNNINHIKRQHGDYVCANLIYNDRKKDKYIFKQADMLKNTIKGLKNE